MSRDYKPRQQKTGSGKPFLAGLLFGILLGVVVTAALTMYIKGDTSPFKMGKNNDGNVVDLPEPTTPDAKKPENDLDFYTILPETESTVTVKELNDVDTSVKKDRYFLQVGSFQDVADADNLKAKLALQGFEAIVQTAIIPDKGSWHRVRVGPFNNIDSINKMREQLATHNFKADLIKVHTETKPD